MRPPRKIRHHDAHQPHPNDSPGSSLPRLALVICPDVMHDESATNLKIGRRLCFHTSWWAATILRVRRTSTMRFLAHWAARPRPVDDKGRLIYMHNDGIFIVTTPIDGEPACHANGGTIGLACASQEEVDAWHAAGIANGGTGVEDPPGVREGGFGPLYLAYLRDPDGNKLCGLARMG